MSNQEQQNSKKLTVPTILGIIFCLILVPILISNLVLIIKGYANPGEIPGYGKTKPLIVLTILVAIVALAFNVIFTSIYGIIAEVGLIVTLVGAGKSKRYFKYHNRQNSQPAEVE